MPQSETFDRFDQAILRRPAKNLAEGAGGGVGVPDFERAQLQHIALCEALKSCGVSLSLLNADKQFPDGSMVGDMAVVTERLAVMSNFAENNPRQGEQQAAASALAGSRFLKFVTAPGLMDAGDVLRLGGRFYIGLTERTNEEGAAQLAFFLKEFGHDSTVVDMREAGMPRLGSAAVYLGRDRIMVREELARHYAFLEYEKIVLEDAEKSAAAALMVNGTLIMPQGFPRLRGELRLMDIPLIEINISEFEKTGANLSRLALRLPATEKGNVVLMESRKQRALA